MRSDGGLYIHVPFCSKVCPYCDFAVTIAGEERRAAYLDALDREIRLTGDRHDLRFDTVYLGGGTPSVLMPDRLHHILSIVDHELDLVGDATLHLEINPDDVDESSASAWRELGFDFASLGVQSFDDGTLAFLGRTHCSADARRAVGFLRGAGFPTVSVDLIFGLPGQTEDEWRRQLETALELGANHLSCYQLTIHGGTVFGRRRTKGFLEELDEDDQAKLYLLTHEVLGAAGWQGYEVSNFAATPEHRSKHNQKYWNHTPYIGLGPSAHSFTGRRRWWNRRKVRLWTSILADGRSPVEGDELLGDTELFFEAVMLGLRTADGIDRAELRQRFGTAIAVLNETAIERLATDGYLHRNGFRIQPTPRGMAVAESIIRAVLP